MLLFAGVLFNSCATPISPSGGPPDREGPSVVETSPETGTTNFEGDEVSFEFNEFVDRNSFRQNVSIEPDLALDYEVNFRRKTATVKFLQPLPENTTVIIKVGTEVTDTDRNNISSAYELAIATGDVLDDGRVVAQLYNANTGRGTSGNKIFLYREPVDYTNSANYIAESDTSGAVQFSYISEGTYSAIYVDDINRNRIWESNRESAQPFSVERIEIEQGQTTELGTLYYSMPDTLAPAVEGGGLLSERRLRMRISEPVIWNNEAFISVMDTLGNAITRAYPLYTQETDLNVFFAQSEDPLAESEFYTIESNGITDSTGNLMSSENLVPFAGSSEPDTTILRTISHNTKNGVFPNDPIEITYSKFIDDDSVMDSLLVVEGDQVYENWEPAEIDRHLLRIFPQDEWQSGTRYQFRVWNPYTEEREQIEPEIWQRNQLGGIEFTIPGSDSSSVHRIELTDLDNSIQVDTTFADSLFLDNLPPLEYKARIYHDENQNNRWNFGTVDPYREPELYIVRRSIPVREGFTSEVEIIFPDGYSPPSAVNDTLETIDINQQR
jgi:hypothetical protein